MTTDTTTVEVGTQLPPLAIEPISRTTLALFAGASGDHNAIHIDIDAAKAAGFDDVFAHGMLSMAFLGRLITSWVPQSRLRALSTRFTSITPVLAQPTCTGTVVSIDDVDGEQRATIELAITLADGTVTLSGEAVVAVN
ncbi:MaoC/PaaZ C-terminal domain-containing protein [Mycolicibacterium diernhoferi]|uniref:Dehydratase n=1 Tax=Mycolicibacterium diernhoferi TaxID=1801 RepID=A0A1Q4HC41_9MYCO|nr:MaoC/PaaZ C-terminal domain-containing protein [Mycolicibacterium diernhoferi]OJZ65090.1 dehydratase [Mycolicibacterium diernhoferi]OPE52386.1 dehydratase [Mycolicibacterium diernhoferi]PEG55018.1 dehydratase [Mycolicibacterium diernhoferi]QYL23699.1 MaoC family dehydratase N-terminal domain-containing protein [Mycolicibacterium diernhoferi]